MDGFREVVEEKKEREKESEQRKEKGIKLEACAGKAWEVAWGGRSQDPGELGTGCRDEVR